VIELDEFEPTPDFDGPKELFRAYAGKKKTFGSLEAQRFDLEQLYIRTHRNFLVKSLKNSIVLIIFFPKILQHANFEL